MLRRGEPGRPFFCNVEVIFQANAKRAWNHYHGFVAEAHAGLQRRLVAAHQIGRFVDAETDSVPGPMRQTGQPVAGAKTASLEKPARGSIDFLAGDSRTNGVEGCLLGAFFNCPDTLDLGRRLAEYIGAGDIRMIPADLAAGIDEHHVAL